MKKYLLCILIIFSLLCFNGCSLFERYDPEEELSVHCGFDFTIYQYSGNVILHDTLGSSDSLELRNEDGEFKKELFKKSYTILDGHFQFFTWNDYKLFIHKNNLRSRNHYHDYRNNHFYSSNSSHRRMELHLC